MTEKEVIAGLTFLSRYAPPEFRPAILKTVVACEEICILNGLDRLRARSVDDLELSVRAANAIQALGIKTVGELELFVNQPDDKILDIGKRYYFTKKPLKEVRLLLMSFGLDKAARLAG